MLSSNAFIDPPQLSAPSTYRFIPNHSRSDSRSPVKQHARDYDPLLRDLSPSATLRAFATDPSEMSGSDVLTASIRSSSIGERALGAKAAQACLELRSWTREMEAWEWPGTFDVSDPARKKVRSSTMTSNSIFSGSTIASAGDGEEAEHWGSMPAKKVQAYEKRADEICQRLDEMDVEELKEYVLATHYRVSSRPPSRDDRMSATSTMTDLKQLDDFTALVTATILQALPYLSRLNRLLDTWTMRLSILRSAHAFLQDLNRARTDMDHGWAAIAVPSTSSSSLAHAHFDRKTMLDMKVMIERQVRGLGRRLDHFLDSLEGREDTVPDSWIDDFELLESAYGSWVVQAERKVLEDEWREGGSRPDSTAPQPSKRVLYENGDTTVASKLEHDAMIRPSAALGDKSPRTHSPVQDTDPPNTAAASKTNAVAELPISNLMDRPIPRLVTDNMGDSKELHNSAITPAKSSREGTPSPSSSNPDSQSQFAKKRAAFLGEIERTNSLKQSKSPPVVRPFEHASNAFTRLFKKDRSPEQIKVKRSVSSKLNSFGSSDDISSANRENQPLSAVSSSTSRFNSIDTDVSRSVSDPLGNTEKLAPEGISKRAKDKVIGSELQSSEKTALPLSARRAQDVKGLDVGSSKSNVPRTYQREGLSSPFHSPSALQSPEDWPLTSPTRSPAASSLAANYMQTSTRLADVGKNDDELHTPAEAIQTDVFDQTFVQPLPDAPGERPRSGRAPHRSTSWAVSQKRDSSLPRSTGHVTAATSRPSIPTDRPDITSATKPRTSSPPSRPQSRFHQGDHSQQHFSPISEPSTHAHNLKSASPDGPIVSVTEPSSAKQTTVDSSLPLPLESPDSIVSTKSREDDIEYERPNVIKRASVASLEFFSRAQVRSIDVPKSSRQNSVSSRVTPPETPQELSIPLDVVKTGNVTAPGSTPQDYEGLDMFPTPPRRSSLPDDTTVTPSRETPPALHTVLSGQDDGDVQGSPLGVATTPNDAPLNGAMRKRRGKSGLRHENQSPNLPKQTGSPSMRRPLLDSGEDNFDRHVSELLETLPNDIRFKARAGAETPAPRGGYSAPRPKMPHTRRISRDHSMTIAPAESSPKKSSLASNPEVKLYHLTQAGRDEPIKLFVRLVGEGERVMVRVGGGWADLADYLRQYAEHHGSRTVSEGGIEVQTMPNALTRIVSGPVELRAKTPVPHRPDSSDSDKDWPIRPTANDGRSTPASERGRQTPTTITPMSSSSTTGSRPSTSNASRPPSRQNAGEVGLGGPSSGKKNSLSEHKAKWVEGMIEKAKQVSAEKSKEDHQKYFGELGKAGGTRRVIFRSSSGVGPK